MTRLVGLCFSLFLSCTAALAQVTVTDPWVRATVAQQKATGAFMKLQAVQDVKLIEAKSPVAGVVEVHEMAMEAGVMKMRAVPGLALPAGQSVELKPGGYHVMLMDLKGQVKEGDVVPLTLVVEGKDGKRQTLEVKATARAMTPGAAPGKAAAHSGMKH
ncbi:MAG: copper chaperone PCu(A)C [Betaproteobacteria bacterium]|jgi:copper(I)-binding protein|nr:copper chaperone PCu(A)C [Burkholderiales bacterium]NBX90560.1 copper chaperone PCu(A)C [Betaproteobacteria bacterium]